jgi:hypothetical protein
VIRVKKPEKLITSLELNRIIYNPANTIPKIRIGVTKVLRVTIPLILLSIMTRLIRPMMRTANLNDIPNLSASTFPAPASITQNRHSINRVTAISRIHPTSQPKEGNKNSSYPGTPTSVTVEYIKSHVHKG